jgi:hypothetical protein
LQSSGYSIRLADGGVNASASTVYERAYLSIMVGFVADSGE